jgi:hypothetical protein
VGENVLLAKRASLVRPEPPYIGESTRASSHHSVRPGPLAGPRSRWYIMLGLLHFIRGQCT